jgi:hypothetical protein
MADSFLMTGLKISQSHSHLIKTTIRLAPEPNTRKRRNRETRKSTMDIELTSQEFCDMTIKEHERFLKSLSYDELNLIAERFNLSMPLAISSHEIKAICWETIACELEFRLKSNNQP